jgi:hypothetical protein
MLAYHHRIALRRSRCGSAEFAGERRHDGFRLVLIEPWKTLLQRVAPKVGVTLEYSLRGLGLALQGAREHCVKTNITQRKIRPQQARLRKPGVGQPIIVIGAESRLTMANDIDGSHVLGFAGEQGRHHHSGTLASAAAPLHGRSIVTHRPPPSRFAN